MGKKRTAGKADYVLGLNKTAFEAGLKSAAKRFQAVGASFLKIGKNLTLFGGAAAGGLGATLKIFSSFDDQMRIVKAVTQASGEEFKRLTELARELGRTTSFTASEVANLQTILGRAGFKSDQIESLTGSVLDLTKAVGGELEPTAGIFAATIRQFNLGADEGARVADALTAAANNSFNSIETLGGALEYAGPVAASANVSLEDTLAILGALGNVGIQGSAAGTSLRRLLTLTGAEADKLKSIFGVSFKDIDGNARDLVTVLDEVNQATADLGTADKAEKFNKAFGLLGITGANVISENAFAIRELQDTIKKSGGVAAATAKEIESGIGGSIRRTLSALEGVALAIAEPLAQPLSIFSKILNENLGLITKFINENQGLILTVGGVAAAALAAGGALTIFGFGAIGVSAALSSMVTLLSAIPVIVASIASPFGLVALAIGGGVAALLTFTDVGSQTATFLSNTFSKLGAIFTSTFDGIKDAFETGDLKLAAEIAFEGVKLAIVTALDEILQVFGSSIQEMIRMISEIPRALQTTVTTVSAALQSLSGVLGKQLGFSDADLRVFNAGLRGVGEGINAVVDGIDVEGFTDKFLNPEEISKRLDHLKAKAAEAKEAVDSIGGGGVGGPQFAFDAPGLEASVAQAAKALKSAGSFSVADLNRKTAGQKAVVDAIEKASKKEIAEMREIVKAVSDSIIRYGV